jgi:SOS-response transcriptional repressor LexA
MQAKREHKENNITLIFWSSPTCREHMSAASSTLLRSFSLQSMLALPLFNGKVVAGFPSPTHDYVEKTLDLNKLLIQKPASPFFIRVQGESMLSVGLIPTIF